MFILIEMYSIQIKEPVSCGGGGVVVSTQTEPHLLFLSLLPQTLGEIVVKSRSSALKPIWQAALRDIHNVFYSNAPSPWLAASQARNDKLKHSDS